MLAARFIAHYPPDLQQPLFFPNGDEAMELRLPRTPDVHHENGSDLNLRTMMIEFDICTFWPEDEERDWKKSRYETHRFDLSTPEGWEKMLQTFPQKVREIVPEGISIQRHARNLLDIPRARNEPEFLQAAQAAHHAAQSIPGEELSPEQTAAIHHALRYLGNKPITREHQERMEQILKEAGLETGPEASMEAPKEEGQE